MSESTETPETTEMDGQTDTMATGGGPGSGVASEAAPTFVVPPAMEDEDTALFAGDTGTLPYEARRALALVLQRRYLAAATHPAEWKALLTYQTVLTSRCHDLFAE